jgi:hypothetical protein
MKTAKALVQELKRHVAPPPGVAIKVIEVPSCGPDSRNWRAAAGPMNDPENDRFSEKVSRLRKSDPLIDWSDEEGQLGHRRVLVRAPKLKE